jgi:hypothetical protein
MSILHVLKILQLTSYLHIKYQIEPHHAAQYPEVLSAWVIL